MPIYTINGKPVSKDEFWTENSTVFVSFSPTQKRFIPEVEKRLNEGCSTRHKAAKTNPLGLCQLIDEINKSKLSKPVLDSCFNNQTTLKQLSDNFSTLKDHYFEYFKNDLWAITKIADTDSLEELEIAIEQITGRTAQEQEIFKQFDIKKEDLKGIQVLTGEYTPKQFTVKGVNGQIFTPMDTMRTGVKHSEGKTPIELDFDFIRQMAERMAANKKNGKYEKWNWKSPINVEEIKEALFRHCLEIMEGRYEDDDRKWGHIEAVATNAMVLNYLLKNY